MPKQKLEIECPVCDAKMSIDARSCPKCGADLGMADFQDLEDLANDMSGGKSTAAPRERQVETECGPSPETAKGEATSSSKEGPIPEKDEPKLESEPSPAVRPKEEKTVEAQDGSTEKKKGLFSKFFGKKK